nr:hypothetical protein [Tanacetum cinerariifolium]
MFEPERPLKRKEQIIMDDQIARDLEAQMQADLKEEQRIAKHKEKEANIAMIRGELSIEEKSKLFVEPMNKRKKHFKILRAEERRIKPPIKAQKRNQMCTYLKNIAGFAHNKLKIKDRVVESSKRPREKLESNKSKKQKLDENVQAEVADNDTAELKRCMEIVPKDDEVTIEATPLSSKFPAIVDYKIYKEGKKSYFKIIKADENSYNYLTFGIMFKNFNIEDLEVLRSIVKTRFEKTKPVNDMDNLLVQILKTMFKHQAHLEKKQTILQLYIIYLKEPVLIEHGDDVPDFKRRRQDFQSDGVMDLVTASGRSQLEVALKDSMLRRCHDYNTTSSRRYYDNVSRPPIHPGSVIDWAFLTTHGLGRNLFNSINTDAFTRLQWANLFQMDEPVFREPKKMSFLKFGWRVGLYFEEQFSLSSTKSVLRRGESVKAEHVLMQFWPITRDYEFVVGGTSGKKIQDPRVKLAHRFIPTTISALELMLPKSLKKNTKCFNAVGEELSAVKHKLMLLDTTAEGRVNTAK